MILKKIGKAIIQPVIWFIVRFLIFVVRFFGKPKAVGLIAPDVPISNLGDQALLCGAVNRLCEFQRLLILVSAGPENASSVLVSLHPRHELVFVDDLHLAFATSKAFWERLRLIWTLRMCEAVYLIGADVMDGTYNEQEVLIKLDIAGEIAKLGIKMNIISSSFSNEIKQNVGKAYTSLDRRISIYARDENSRRRLCHFFPSVKLAADVAFFLSPGVAPDIESRVEDFKTVIGVCLKDSDVGLHANEKASIVKSLQYYAEKGTGFVFLPHHPLDLKVAQDLASYLDDKSVLWLPSVLPSAAAIKATVKYCDLVITGRMHVAIASLGVGVPVLCFSYASKFEGLLKHFHLPENEMIVNRAVEDFDRHLCAKIDGLLTSQHQHRSRIKSYLPTVIALAAENFSSLKK